MFIIEGEESFGDEDKVGVVQKETESEPSIKELTEPIISSHALVGSNSYQAMRVKGYISRKPMIILIDSGSTHNFLNPVVAKRTGCLVEQTNPFSVTVADGSQITSSAICKKMQWVMHGTIFEADMRLLPLGGCDLVLGVEWLAELGLIVWDFKNLKMEFTTKGKRHVLRGSTAGPMKLVETNRVRHLLRRSNHGLWHNYVPST